MPDSGLGVENIEVGADADFAAKAFLADMLRNFSREGFQLRRFSVRILVRVLTWRWFCSHIAPLKKPSVRIISINQYLKLNELRKFNLFCHVAS
jgi:hypothetical protein